jgi:hypothetical protein
MNYPRTYCIDFKTMGMYCTLHFLIKTNTKAEINWFIFWRHSILIINMNGELYFSIKRLLTFPFDTLVIFRLNVRKWARRRAINRENPMMPKQILLLCWATRFAFNSRGMLNGDRTIPALLTEREIWVFASIQNEPLSPIALVGDRGRTATWPQTGVVCWASRVTLARATPPPGGCFAGGIFASWSLLLPSICAAHLQLAPLQPDVYMCVFRPLLARKSLCV